MGYALRSGISFALVGGRFLFLDAPHDRYFCLSAPAEAAFADLVHGDTPSEARALRIARLVQDGLLVPADPGTRPLPCLAPTRATESLLDWDLPDATALETLAAVRRLATTRLALRIGGFGALVRRAERRIGLAGIAPDPASDRLPYLAAAYRRAATLRSSLDLCLPRAFAAASHMLARGIAPTLVIGVRLGPFVAHCWVQSGPRLLLDHPDEVATFTPVRVLTR